MPKIIPLGEIDPVLYGIAKRRAAMMEQGTMSFVGAFENELGRIIFKRVGQGVHAIVEAAGFVSNLVGYLEPDTPRNYSQLGGTPVSFDWGAYGFRANDAPLLATTPPEQIDARVAHTSTGWIGFSQDTDVYPFVQQMHWGEIGGANEVQTLDLTPNQQGFTFPPGVPSMRAEFDLLSASMGNFGSSAALVQWIYKDTRTSLPSEWFDEYENFLKLHVMRDGQRTEHLLATTFGTSIIPLTAIPATSTGTVFKTMPSCCANRTGDIFAWTLEGTPVPAPGSTGLEATMRLWHESGGTITDLSHLVADPDPELRFKVVPNAWDGPILAVCIVYKPDPVIEGRSLIETRFITLRRVDDEIVGTTCTGQLIDTLPNAALHDRHMLCGPTLYLNNPAGGVSRLLAIDTQDGIVTGNAVSGGTVGVDVRFATNGRRTYIVGRDEAKLISPALFQQGVTTPTLPPAPDAAVFIRTKTR